MTHNEHQILLIEALKRICYSIRNCGCGYYQIVNNLGKCTKFIFDSERIELKDDVIFGADRRIKKYGEAGWIVFHFKSCEIEFDEEYGLFI